MTTSAADPILLELLRSRLQAVVDEGALAIEQTAVSPIVAEGKDFACNVLGPDAASCSRVAARSSTSGRARATSWRRRSNATAARSSPATCSPRTTRTTAAATTRRTSRSAGRCSSTTRLVAWVAASAHLIDVGGMTFGSWAPDATECYQEAIRFPSVRLFAGGVEQSDTWALILNNVRLAEPRRDGHPRPRCRLSRVGGEARRRGRVARRRRVRRDRRRRCATTPSASCASGSAASPTAPTRPTAGSSGATSSTTCRAGSTVDGD